MRHYIKTLAMLLMVSLGFVACNDSDDFDEYKVNYPTTMPLGYYHSNHTFDSDYEYGVLLTKNAANDTVIQILMEGKPEGNDSASVRTVLTSSEMVYNDTIGMMVVKSDGDNFFEKKVKAYIAYKKDRNHMILSMEYAGSKVSTVLTPTNETPAVASRWSAGNFVLDLKNVGKDGKLPGTLDLDAEDEVKAEKVTWSYANGVGEFTTNAGKKGTFQYVANYLLEVTFEGKTYTCDRTYSNPEPESFTTIAVGTMVYGVQSLAQDGSVLFKAQHEAEIGQSDKNPHRYCLMPWLQNPEGLIFEVDPATGNVKVPLQLTGFDSSQLGVDWGPIYGIDTFSLLGQINSAVQGKNIMFAMAYVANNNPVAFQVDVFQITDGVAPTSVQNTFKPEAKTFATVSLKK